MYFDARISSFFSGHSVLWHRDAVVQSKHRRIWMTKITPNRQHFSILAWPGTIIWCFTRQMAKNRQSLASNLEKRLSHHVFLGLNPSTRYEINSNFVSSNSLSKPPFFLGATTPFHFGSSHLPHLEKAHVGTLLGFPDFLGWQIAKPKKMRWVESQNCTFWDSTSFKIHFLPRPSRLKTLAKLKMILKIELIYKSTGKTVFFFQPN